MIELPALIRQIRLSLGETQKQFGTRFAVSVPLVSQWESGGREPNVDVFVFILKNQLSSTRSSVLKEVRDLFVQERVVYKRKILCDCPCKGPYCNVFTHQCDKPDAHYPQAEEAYVLARNALRSELLTKLSELEGK